MASSSKVNSLVNSGNEKKSLSSKKNRKNEIESSPDFLKDNELLNNTLDDFYKNNSGRDLMSEMGLTPDDLIVFAPDGSAQSSTSTTTPQNVVVIPEGLEGVTLLPPSPLQDAEGYKKKAGNKQNLQSQISNNSVNLFNIRKKHYLNVGLASIKNMRSIIKNISNKKLVHEIENICTLNETFYFGLKYEKEIKNFFGYAQ